MPRFTRKWLHARLDRLQRALRRTDLEFEIWSPGDRHGTRYQVKSDGGRRDFGPVGNAREMDYFLGGAIATAESLRLYQDSGATYQVGPGRTIERDGRPVADVGGIESTISRAMGQAYTIGRPTDLDGFTHAIVRALNLAGDADPRD